MAAQTRATLGGAIVNLIYKKIVEDRGDDYFMYRNANAFTASNSGDLQIVKAPPPELGAIGTEGTAPSSESAFYYGKETYKPYIYNKYFIPTPEQMAASIKDVTRFYSDTVKNSAMKTAERDMHKKFTCNSLLIRADANDTYTKVFTIDATGSDTSNWETDELTQASDFWNGGVGGFTNRKLFGQFRPIDDFETTENELQVSTSNTLWTQSDVVGETPADNDTGIVTVGRGIGSSVVFTTSAIELALYYLNKYHAPYFKGTSYQYKFGIQPQIRWDLQQDDDWRKSAIYNDTTKLERGFEKQWMGALGYSMDEGYRTNVPDGGASTKGVGTAHSATGDCFYTPFFGPDAFGCYKLTSHTDQGTGIANIKVYVIDYPDHTNMTLAFITMSYSIRSCAVVKNGLGGLSVVSGTSAPTT